MGHQEKEKKNSLREKMPCTSAWVDELRTAFGEDEINQAIRKGMAGKQTFHARENGFEIGTSLASGFVVSCCDMVIDKTADDESGRAKRSRSGR